MKSDARKLLEDLIKFRNESQSMEEYNDITKVIDRLIQIVNAEVSNG